MKHGIGSVVVKSVINLLCILMVPLAVVYVVTATEEYPGDAAKDEGSATPQTIVSVVEIQSSTYRASIELNGEVRPAHELDLVAEVGGRVREISSDFVVGNKVDEGVVLLKLEDAEFKAAVEAANHEIDAAKLELLTEEQQAKVARTLWEKSQGSEKEPGTPLTFRIPQVESAQSKLVAATENLKHYKARLASTRLITPFDAVIASRMVSPGSVISVGQSVGKLFGVAYVEILLSVSEKQWSILPSDDDTGQVRVRIVDNSQYHWVGEIARTSNFINPKTRMRELVVNVALPLEQNPPLLPGSFVTVTLRGRHVSGLFKVPATAITADGYVWYVQDGHLNRFEADIQFGEGQWVFVAAPEGLITIAVAQNPLLSYEVGTEVVTRFDRKAS